MRTLIVLVLLAGCLGPAAQEMDPPPSGGDPAPVAAWSFKETHVGTASNSQREAFVAVTPDGMDVLVCGHGYFQRPAHLWHSADGGRTFDEVSFPMEAGVSGDCEVAVEGDAWTVLHSTAAGATVTTSFDRGATWSVNPVSAIPVNGLADRPWIAYVDGVLMLTFMPLSMQPGTIGFARSHDHGATWSRPAWLLPPDPEGPRVIQGDFVVAPDNQTVRVPLSREVALGPRLSFAVSTDAGASWHEQPVPLAPSTHTNPVGVAQAGDGRIYWAYPTAGGLALSWSDGDGWTEPHVIGPGLAWPRPAASGRSEGAVFLWESDGTETGTNQTTIVAARVLGNRTEYVPLIEGPLIEFASVVHDRNDRAVAAVAYSSNPNRAVPNPEARTSDFFVFVEAP